MNSRKTIVQPDGKWWVTGNDEQPVPWKDIPHSLYCALCKLKDYEDTGLNPDEIREAE